MVGKAKWKPFEWLLPTSTVKKRQPHISEIESVKVLVAQLCPTLCDAMNYSLPGSSVHGILQARKLEWVAIPISGDLPNPEIKSKFPALQADSLPAELSVK